MEVLTKLEIVQATVLHSFSKSH